MAFYFPLILIKLSLISLKFKIIDSIEKYFPFKYKSFPIIEVYVILNISSSFKHSMSTLLILLHFLLFFSKIINLLQVYGLTLYIKHLLFSKNGQY